CALLYFVSANLPEPSQCPRKAASGARRSGGVCAAAHTATINQHNDFLSAMLSPHRDHGSSTMGGHCKGKLRPRPIFLCNVSLFLDSRRLWPSNDHLHSSKKRSPTARGRGRKVSMPSSSAAQRPKLSSSERQQLGDAARQMLTRSYAPYSQFHVGCAVLTEAG